jgi:HPt (histidine-containing phosphotransfer) domain-containing protein
MTAYALKGDRERFLAAGMDGYVSKPIRPESLYSAIDAVVLPKASAKTSSPVSDPVNWRLALEAVGGNEQLLRSMVKAGLDEIPSLLGALRGAVSGNDAAGVGRAAHTLKTCLRYLAADSAADLAHQIEILGRDGRVSDASDLLPEFTIDIERAISVMSSFVERESD